MDCAGCSSQGLRHRVSRGISVRQGPWPASAVMTLFTADPATSVTRSPPAGDSRKRLQAISASVFPANGPLASQHLLQQHGDREEIAAMIDSATQALLRRHVARGTDGHAVKGQVRAIEPGNAEVRDLDPPTGQSVGHCPA